MKFGKRYEMTLNRVHDNLTIREGSERLSLTVDGDSMRMVAGINVAQKKMNDVVTKEEPTEEEIRDAAETFATVIFGKDQTEKLFAFYNDDPGCVISICGQYFKNRLAYKIAKVQKRLKL